MHLNGKKTWYTGFLNHQFWYRSQKIWYRSGLDVTNNSEQLLRRAQTWTFSDTRANFVNSLSFLPHAPFTIFVCFFVFSFFSFFMNYNLSRKHSDVQVFRFSAPWRKMFWEMLFHILAITFNTKTRFWNYEMTTCYNTVFVYFFTTEMMIWQKPKGIWSFKWHIYRNHKTNGVLLDSRVVHTIWNLKKNTHCTYFKSIQIYKCYFYPFWCQFDSLFHSFKTFCC